MRRSRYAALGALALAVAALAVPAQTAGPALAGFERVLPLLQPPDRERLQQRARLWQRWTAAERNAQIERIRAWDTLPAGERGERRERYLAWKALPPAERARLQAAHAAFVALPPPRQQALRARFDALDRSDMRGWRLGPDLGADYPTLQPLLAHVPADEHAPLLRALRSTTPQQRADLAALVQRTPPQERDVLRRELASTAASNRDDWLYERLQR